MPQEAKNIWFGLNLSNKNNARLVLIAILSWLVQQLALLIAIRELQMPL